MIDKTITLITVTWGDYIKIGNMALGHSLAQFPYFTKVHNFTHINNLEDYNIFFVEELSKKIDTDFVLTVQPDGFILNPQKWDNQFLEYDYIGAPWPWTMSCGNGGFSLRSKKFLELSSVLLYDKTHHEYPLCPEDYFLCVKNRQHFINNGCKFAPVDVALRFSFEHPIASIPNHTVVDSFGFHGKHNLR
jgi:hypothetical protein